MSDRIYIEKSRLTALLINLGNLDERFTLNEVEDAIDALASEGGEEREPNVVTEDEALDFAYARERLEADGINLDHADLHHIGRVFDRLTAWIEDNDPPDCQPGSGERAPCLAVAHDHLDCSHLPREDRCRNCRSESGEGEDWPPDDMYRLTGMPEGMGEVYRVDGGEGMPDDPDRYETRRYIPAPKDRPMTDYLEKAFEAANAAVNQYELRGTGDGMRKAIIAAAPVISRQAEWERDEARRKLGECEEDKRAAADHHRADDRARVEERLDRAMYINEGDSPEFLEAAQSSVVWSGGTPGLDELQHAIGTFIETALSVEGQQ